MSKRKIAEVFGPSTFGPSTFRPSTFGPSTFRPSTFLDTLYYEHYLNFEHEHNKDPNHGNYEYSNNWIIEDTEKKALSYVKKELTFTNSENVLNHFKLLRYIVLHYCNSLNNTSSSLANYFEFLKSVLFISLEQEGISLDHYVPKGGELYNRLSDPNYVIGTTTTTTPIFKEDNSIKISNTRVHQFLELAKCNLEIFKCTKRRRVIGGKKFSKKKKHKKFKNNINNNSFI